MTSANTTILVSVSDPVLHPEALHVAAATGRRVIDTTDPGEISRHHPRVDAVLVDGANAGVVAGLPRRRQIFFLAADPGPVDWRAALEVHAEQALVIPAQAAELLRVLGRDGASPTDDGVVLGVVGAAGGAGVSTLAAAIARAAGAQRNAALVDAAPGAGGLDLLLGVEEAGGARWQELQLGQGAVAAEDLRAALPTTPDGIAVLTGSRSTVADPYRLTGSELSAALHSFRGGDGLSVVDLPAGTELTEAAVEHCDCVVLLTPAEVRPVAAAAQQLSRWRARQVDVHLIVRHRGWSGLELPDIEKVTRCEVIAEIGTVGKLARQVEMQGLPLSLPRTLATAAQAVLAEVTPRRPGRAA